MGRSFSTLCFLIVGLCFLLGTSAFPLDTLYDPNNGTAESMLNVLEPRQNGKSSLRIMPLGASITQGIASSPMNGYRRKLREQLRFVGHEVDMIGCETHGDFNDRQHEGHPSKKIADMIGYATCSIGQLPNVVLLHVGTNDCTGAKDDATIDKAGDDYLRLVEWLFEKSPDVTVIVSTLLPNVSPSGNAYVNKLNDRIRSIASDMRQSHKIILAEMAKGYIPMEDIVDGTHPNPLGYAKMAAVWADTIARAEDARLITPPRENGRGDGDNTDSQCANTPPSRGNFGPKTQTQTGSGADDGTYTHATEPAVTIIENMKRFKEQNARSTLKQFHFAQLVNINNLDKGGETDEIIEVVDFLNKENVLSPGSIWFQLNDGGKFNSAWLPIDVKQKCLNRGVRWGDVNGDGLDDFICLSYPAGDMYVSINKGGNPPTFEHVGLVRKSEPWATQDRIRLGDIDGDGRLDWCAIDDVGDIYCWRNGGINLPIPEQKGYWQGMVGGSWTFKAQGMPGIEGVRLVDINGDQRADWVYVFPDGHTRIFINQRGTKADGPGLRPSWVEAAVAHRGFPGDKSIDRDNIKFGRIFGTGRADYIHHIEKEEKQQMTHTFRAFKNIGKGGMRLKGDGARYCDMFGRGYDDYIWIWSGGEIELFENTQALPAWKVHGQIYNVKRDRKSVHFGDWDGDGLCDILTVEKHTGVTHMYKNTWKPGKPHPTFNDPVRVTEGWCKEGWGVGLNDLGLRFADIDGDGRVDYLCMEKDGRTWGYLNKKSGPEYMNQIKFSEGYDRANHRWADVNADGKADFLWVDKFTGNVQVWLNGGRMDTGGSKFFWPKQGNIWREGVDRGQNIHFPKLGTLGRADYHQVLPKTSQAFTYYNTCGGAETGGDDGDIVDPKLPALPEDNASRICKRDESDFLCELKRTASNVDWQLSSQTCSDEQLQILHDAHLNAVKVMEFTGDLENAYSTTGFHKYFVRTPAWTQNQYWKPQIEKSREVLKLAKGPIEPGSKRDRKEFKITYHCKKPSWAARDCRAVGVAGFTYNSKEDLDCPLCSNIRICPLFWKSTPINNFGNGTSVGEYLKKKDRLPIPNDFPYLFDTERVWNPQEQVLIHEWFHIRRSDTDPSFGLYHVEDVQDTLRTHVSQTTYGFHYPSRWAWYGFGGYENLAEGKIQEKAMLNADNFAWMYMYNYMEYLWSWNDDGSFKYKWVPDDIQNKEWPKIESGEWGLW